LVVYYFEKLNADGGIVYKIIVFLFFVLLQSVLASVSVTQTGALSFDYPITLPDGMGGVAPSLSVSYNSQHEDGVLGKGFFLSGISTIARDSRCKVRFNTDDHFMMDRQKLIFNEKTGYYHTEKEEFLRIKANTPNMPNSNWVVTHRNGKRYIYGSDSTSRIDAVRVGFKDTKQVVIWALNRIVSTSGNYCDLDYFEDKANGAFYPRSITYTKNDQHPLKAVHTIEFEYEQNTGRIIPTYQPSYVLQTKRLKRITCKTAGNLVRAYEFLYELSPLNHASLLKAIRECGADGKTYLPDMTFDWSCTDNPTVAPITFAPKKMWSNSDVFSATNGAGAACPTWSVNGNIKATLLDMNGDGLPDRVGPLAKDENKLGLWVALNTGSGWKAATYWGNPLGGIPGTFVKHSDTRDITALSPYQANTLSKELWSQSFTAPILSMAKVRLQTVTQQLVDINGDQLPDRVGNYNYKTSEVGFWVALNTRNGFSVPIKWDCDLFQGTNDIALLKELSSPSSDSGATLLDMNGDGLLDRVSPKKYVDGKLYPGFWVAINSGTGFKKSQNWAVDCNLFNKAYPHSYFPFQMQYSSDRSTEMMLSCLSDMNGDGLPDRVSCTNYSSTDQKIFGFYVAINNGKGFNPPTNWSMGCPIFSEKDKFPRLFPDKETYKILCPYGDWEWPPQCGAPYYICNRSPLFDDNYARFFPVIGNGKYANLIDINGDGLPDRVKARSDSVIQVAFNTGSGFSDQIITLDSLSDEILSDNKVTPLFYALYRDCPDVGEVGFAGYGNVYSSSDSNLYTSRSLIDLDGDGRVDQLKHRNDSLFFFQNMGMGFAGPHYLENSFGGKGQGFASWGFDRSKDIDHDTAYAYQLLVDMNGDGILDRVGHYDYKSNQSGFWVALGQVPPEIISQIRTGQGASFKIEYEYVSAMTGAIMPKVSSYPEISVNTGVYLVKTLRQFDGLDDCARVDYSFADVRLSMGNKMDARFLGFRSMSKKDSASGVLIKNEYNLDFPLEMTVKSESVFDGKGALMSRTNYEYSIRKGGSITNRFSPLGSYYSFQKRQTKIAYDGGKAALARSVKEFYQDPYGNVNQVYDSGLVADPYDDSRVLTQYAYNLDSWIVDKSIQTKIQGYNGDHEWTLQQWKEYLYDNQDYGVVVRGNITHEHIFPSQKDTVEFRHVYNAYGMPIKEISGRGFVTQTEYDTLFSQYATTITDAAGQKSRYEYDSLMRITRVIDINGIASRNQYDALGRIIKKWNWPDTSDLYPSEVSSYKLDGVAPEYSVTSRRVEPNTRKMQSVAIFSDGLGRVIQKKQKLNDTCYIITDTWYDSFGKECRTSVPYYAKELLTPRAKDQPFSTKQYDAVGRLVSEKNVDKSETRYFYKGNQCTVVDAVGHAIVRKENGAGDVISLTLCKGVYPNILPYSITKYSYNTGTGQLFNIVDHDGNTTRFTYDLMLRQLSIDDPDVGLVSFAYDKNGNRVRSINGKNDTTIFVYDNLDRKKLEKYQDGPDVHYFFDEVNKANSRGRLCRVVHADDIDDSLNQERFEYLPSGELSSHSISIDGETRTMRYEYDALTRPTSIIYPDGEVLHRKYGQEGEAIRIYSLSTNYVASASYNTRSMVQKMQFGNGVTTTFSYYDSPTDVDLSSGLAQNYRLKSIDAPGVFSAKYEYDRVGNIMNRTDLLAPLNSEQYDYDALNRLTYALGRYGEKQYGYNEIGNIVRKDKIVYVYHSVKPHAVIGKGEKSYAYDTLGNMITSDGVSYTYNSLGNLISAGNDSYSYFGGMRMRKEENGIVTRYFFPEYEEISRPGKPVEKVKYYDFNKNRVAKRSSREGLSYIHQDHLASTTCITDAEGKVIARQGYEPYGGEDYSLVNSGVTVQYRFSGKEQDLSGLYYFGARYYNTELGRFITPDNGVPSTFDPQTLNRYSFARNNPVVYIDQNGECIDIMYYLIAAMAIYNGIQNGWQSALVTLGTAAISYGVFTPVSTSVGAAVGSNFAGYLAGGLAAGTLSGAFSSIVYGGDMLQGMLMGAVQGGVSSMVTAGVGQLTGVNLDQIMQQQRCLTPSEIGLVVAGSTAGYSITNGLMAAISGRDVGDAFATGAIHGALNGMATTLAIASQSKCFPAGTMVLTKEGMSPIETIRVGDSVWSINEGSGLKELKVVTKISIRQADGIVAIVLPQETIEATPEHPFRVVGSKESWLEAGYLKPGMKLKAIDGEQFTIQNTIRQSNKVKVYNFEVAQNHSYCVGMRGVLVHNYTFVEDEAYSIEGDAGNPEISVFAVAGKAKFETGYELGGNYKGWKIVGDGKSLSRSYNSAFRYKWSMSGPKLGGPIPASCGGIPCFFLAEGTLSLTAADFDYPYFLGADGVVMGHGVQVCGEGRGALGGGLGVYSGKGYGDLAAGVKVQVQGKACVNVCATVQGPARDPDKYYGMCRPVICTELHKQGMLPDNIFKADQKFGQYLNENYPLVTKGYHFWAIPLTKMMKRSKLLSRALYVFAYPWAQEMAYRMGESDRGHWLGRIILYVGVPACFLLGLILTYILPITMISLFAIGIAKFKFRRKKRILV